MIKEQRRKRMVQKKLAARRESARQERLGPAPTLVADNPYVKLATVINPEKKGWPWVPVKKHGHWIPVPCEFTNLDHCTKMVEWASKQPWWTVELEDTGVSPATAFSHYADQFASQIIDGKTYTKTLFNMIRQFACKEGHETNSQAE